MNITPKHTRFGFVSGWPNGWQWNKWGFEHERYLHLQFAESEEGRHGVVLQHAVVAFSFETVFGEVLRADVTVLGGFEVSSFHSGHPFPTDIRPGQRKPAQVTENNRNDMKSQITSLINSKWQVKIYTTHQWWRRTNLHITYRQTTHKAQQTHHTPHTGLQNGPETVNISVIRRMTYPFVSLYHTFSPQLYPQASVLSVLLFD